MHRQFSTDHWHSLLQGCLGFYNIFHYIVKYQYQFVDEDFEGSIFAWQIVEFHLVATAHHKLVAGHVFLLKNFLKPVVYAHVLLQSVVLLNRHRPFQLAIVQLAFGVDHYYANFECPLLGLKGHRCD